MNDATGRSLPAFLPLDVRRGVTAAADAAHPLRWGILGAGSIATQWVEVLAACAGATVTAVAARERSRAEQFAARFGIATAYGDYAEMVAAPDVDIVYVGTITGLHKEHTLLALAAGKQRAVREAAGRQRRRRARHVRRGGRAERDAAGCDVDRASSRRSSTPAR